MTPSASDDSITPKRPEATSKKDQGEIFNFFDSNYVAPYVQNLTLSVTRNVRNNLTVDFRYIGTLARKQFTSINLNSANFLYNGMLDEFNKVRIGAESAVLDRMMQGVNICTTGCTTGVSYGPIGSTLDGVPQTAALQMRSSSTFNQNLGNGNYSAVATSLATLNYVKTGCPSSTTGNCNLTDVNTSLVRGSVLRQNGVAENFILTHPQFATANCLANMGNNNYHSLQAEVTMRPTHGLSGTANYTWSRVGRSSRHADRGKLFRSGKMDESDGSAVRFRQLANYNRKRAMSAAGCRQDRSGGYGRFRSSQRWQREFRRHRASESSAWKAREPRAKRPARPPGLALRHEYFQVVPDRGIEEPAFRVDAFNVLNHPQPGNPNLSINPNLTAGPTLGAAIPWGQITTKTGGRVFQGQLRLQF